MAITIDGSANTIAGLAVGGVPDNTIDNGTMADDAIGIAELSATGTASSSTFLRGDNTWAAVDTSIADDSITEAKLDVSNAPTNGQFLQAQSGEGGGLTWAAAGGGKVLQYVWETSNTEATSTSVNVEVMDATITPTSASSKILVQCTLRIYSDANSYAFYGGYIKRGDASGTTVATYQGGYVGAHDIEVTQFIQWLDTPNTTSAQEYTLILSRWSSGTTSASTGTYMNTMLLTELEG